MLTPAGGTGQVSPVSWPDVPPTLTDGTVSLRAWRASDAEAVLDACQDAELQHWIPVPVPYLAEHARGFVEDFATQQWSSRQGVPFAAVDTHTGRLLGAPSLKAVDHERRVAEVGYWVAPWARGQQVAQRAVRLLRDWAFTDLGLHRLELFIEPANAASCAVAERVGAVREALLRDDEVIRGTSRDMVRYALEK